MNTCCEKKKNNGLLSGFLLGLIPHSGCILFFVFAVLGATTISAIFRNFLLSQYSFYWLAGISLLFAIVSAAIYLVKNKAFNILGIKNNWRYLSTLLSGIVLTNLLFFLIIFPMAANFSLSGNNIDGSVFSNKLALVVDIPCSGHAPIIIGDLKRMSGVGSVSFKFPNSFDISYDPNLTSGEDILSASIFKIFKAKQNI